MDMGITHGTQDKPLVVAAVGVRRGFFGHEVVCSCFDGEIMMVGRIMTAVAMLSVALLLSACGDFDAPPVHSYRTLPQNLPSNAAPESPNSMPR
jgi:hypothetical protein